MSNEYYPLSNNVCHHFYNNGGCTFCGYRFQRRTVASKQLSIGDQLVHFDGFLSENLDEVMEKDRLVIAPNGSWFTQVPLLLRQCVYHVVDMYGISELKYESRATLFRKGSARRELMEMYKHTAKGNAGKLADKALDALVASWDEISPGHVVSFGLEVANNEDLAIVNKGCQLKDYEHAAKFVHDKGAKVCANILIGPPRVQAPIKKAFETDQFAAEVMEADEFLVMPCTPMCGTQGYEDWVDRPGSPARWNPVSATAASEVFRIIRDRFPQKAKYQDLRVFTKHGRHGRFKRKPGKWPEEEKRNVRRAVRGVAKQVLG
jgi:hypothetical protein